MINKYLFRRLLKSLLFFFFLSLFLTSNNEIKAQGLEGKEFYLTFLPNRLVYNYNQGKFIPVSYSEVQITIIASEFTNVEITVPHLNYSKSIILPANKSDTVKFKSSQFDFHEFGTKVNQPIIIKSDNKISVFALHYMQHSSDGTMFLPLNSLGNNYIVNSIENVSNFRTRGSTPSNLRIFQDSGIERYHFKVMSVEDNNLITIKTDQVDLNSALNIGENQITLNKGESISYEMSSSPDGIEINSELPILVLSGIQDAEIPQGQCCPDHIFHIEYPIEFLKNNYLLIPFDGRNKLLDFYNITSLADNNEIKFNGNLIKTLNKSKSHGDKITEPTYIESTHEISVSQYAASSGNFGGTYGDPFKVQLLPIDQMCDDIRYSLIWSQNISNYFAIFLKYKNDEFKVNGEIETGFKEIPGSDFEYKYKKQGIGTYRVETEKGAMVIGYGFGGHDSYGYMAGACFEKIDPKFFINDSLRKSVICYDEGLTIRAESEEELESLEWTINDTLVVTGNPIDLGMLTEPGMYNIRLKLNNNDRQISFYEIERLGEIEIELADTLFVCKDAVYEVEALVTGVGSMTYSWTPNENLLNSEGYKARFKEPITEETTLYFDVISEYGCTKSDSIKIVPINKIDLDIPDQITICAGDPVPELEFQDVIYRYYNSVGKLYYESSSYFDGFLHLTTVEIEQKNGDCVFFDSTLIFIHDLPEIETKDFPIAACPGTWRDYEIPVVQGVIVNWKITGGKIIDWYDAESINADSTELTNGYKARILWEEPGTGIIELEVIDDLTGCTNIVTENIPINNLLNPTIKANGVLAYDTVNVCFGEEMILDAGVDFDEYYWYKEVFEQGGTPYSTNREISIDEEGLYIINVYNELACIGLDSIYVRIYDLPNISAGNDTSICYNTSTVLRATGGDSYEWYINDELISTADTLLYDYTISNSIELVGADINGCINYDTMNVEVYNEVTVNLIDEYFICENEILTIDNLEILGVDGISEINWSSDNSENEIISLADNKAEVHARVNGSYRVDIIDNNGCEHFATFEVYIQEIRTTLTYQPEVCFDETQVITARIINKVINQKKNSVALVLDISKDMDQQNMYLSKLGAKSFLDLLDRERVEVCLITFDDFVYLEQEFTNDFDLLKTKIDNLRQNSGSNYDAALLDYTLSAIPYIKSNANFEVRDIVFFTGSNSAINSSEVISECNDNNITFHSILLGNTTNSTLESISNQTGGIYLTGVNDQNSVINSYRNVYNSTIINPFTYEWQSAEIDLSSEDGDRLILNNFEPGLRTVNIDLSVRDTVTSCSYDTTLSFQINPLPTFELIALNDVCIGDTAIYKLQIDSLYNEYSILWVEADTGPLIIDESDSTVIRFVKSLSNNFSVEINDSVSCAANQEYEFSSTRSVVKFEIEDIISSPKVYNQKVRINTFVDSLRCITDESFTIKLSVNSKIFNPLGIESDGQEILMDKKYNIIDSKWELSFELSSNEISENKLFLVGDAILADAYSYPIEIDSVLYNEQTTEVEVINGSITLDEICEEGETRLLNYSNFFNILNSYPNPTSNNIKLEVITSDKDINIELTCTDYLGKIYRVPYTINDTQEEIFNKFEVDVNLEKLNSGMYRITIGNGKFNKTIKVIKK